MPGRRHVLVVSRFIALKIADKHRRLKGVFGTPKRGGTVFSRTDSEDPGTFWLHDAPVVFLTLREHCDTIRNVFDPRMWQLPMVYPKGDRKALELVDKQDGRDVAMLYQEESSAGHHDYTAYPAFEEPPGLARLKVRANISQDVDEDIRYSITFYESPYSAYRESESTKEQFQEWREARNGCFLREANFGDVGDKVFVGIVPRRYSD